MEATSVAFFCFLESERIASVLFGLAYTPSDDDGVGVSVPLTTGRGCLRSVYA